MNVRLTALQQALAQAHENLELIQERQAEYVEQNTVRLQLIKEERHLAKRIRWLERQIEQMRPMELLRMATKLLVGPVALALEGRQWKGLKQQLLRQASGHPASYHLDVVALGTATDDLARLIGELRVLLEAHRIEPNPGQLEALERRAAQLGSNLVNIYQLLPGEAPELDTLVGEAQFKKEVEDVFKEAIGGPIVKSVSVEGMHQTAVALPIAAS